VFGSLATGSPRSLFGCFDNGLDFHLAAITGAASTHDRREERFAVNYEGTDTAGCNFVKIFAAPGRRNS
jgi:hypothetical protein